MSLDRLGALFASGAVVDLVLAFIALEAILLLAWRARSGRGPTRGALVANLLAGAFLLVAMRLALAGAAWPWTAGSLLGALAAHAWDLRERWR